MSAIVEFYKGRTLFITGVTGFMGKVLLEKLIRSIPDLERIYVLIRAKKGISLEERLKQLTGNLIFTFNNIEQKSLNKIVAINGDIKEENFGMSEYDKQKLIDEVSVVFHLAASIRMDLGLKEAVITNTKSTYELLKFCMKIKRLVSVVHLSTAYCNVEISHMDEKVYPLNVDPYKIIDLVEWMDEKSLAAIENNIIDPHPNTYTFTKRLSEIIVRDMGKKLPVVIVRPSIVTPALCEPIPGWVDSYYGPVGLFIAGGKGVLRTALLDHNLSPQIIPVDIAINGLIISGYERASETYSETPVINMTQGQMYEMTWGYMIEYLMNWAHRYPFKKVLWYPRTSYTKNYRVYLFCSIVFHFIPALVVDFFLIMLLQKPFLFAIQRRIFLAFNLFYHFTVTEWNFSNTEAIKISKKLSSEDNNIFFGIADMDIDLNKYITNAYFSSRKYLAKEDVEDLGFYRLQLKIMYVADIFIKLLFCYGVLKYAWSLVEHLF